MIIFADDTTPHVDPSPEDFQRVCHAVFKELIRLRDAGEIVVMTFRERYGFATEEERIEYMRKLQDEHSRKEV